MKKTYTAKEAEAMSFAEKVRIMNEVEAVFNENDEFDYDATCEGCPFCEICGQLRLFTGCEHWEAYMGGDL